MARERRNQLVLAALAMVFAAVAYQQWPTTIEAPAASNDVQGPSSECHPWPRRLSHRRPQRRRSR
jgi:hypothetical protein